MRFPRILAPAAGLVFAAGLTAQTPGPTTGGSAPAPSSPTTGGFVPTGGAAPRPMVIFPTNPGGMPTGTTTPAPVVASGIFPTQVIDVTGIPAAINLTGRQQMELNTLTQKLQAQFQPEYDRLSGLQADQQAAQREQLNREYTAAWFNSARNVFTADQLARYQQLQFQFGGFNSLNDPVAQKALSLTDAQVAQLKQDVAWAAQQQAAIQQAARTNQARALELSNAFTTASEQRLNKLLTPAQQQTFAQLAGNRIAFPPIFPAATGTTGTTGTATPGVTTIPGRTGLGGSPLPTPGAIGPTRPTPLTPGAPGPTTGGTATPPVGPTTGGPAPAPGPTTGGTRPGGGPTTGGTVPGGPGSPTPPKR